MSQINRNNFYISSQAVFEKSVAPERDADFTSYSKMLVKEYEIDGIRRNDDGEPIEIIMYEYDDVISYTNEEFEWKKGKYGDLIFFVSMEGESEFISSRYWYTEEGVYRESKHWGKVANCQWDLNSNEHGKVTGFARWEDFEYNLKAMANKAEKHKVVGDFMSDTIYTISPKNIKVRFYKSDPSTPSSDAIIQFLKRNEQHPDGGFIESFQAICEIVDNKLKCVRREAMQIWETYIELNNISIENTSLEKQTING